MREPKTLKGLFPDIKPIRRKNFIKENVKNLRRLEQSFQSGKDQNTRGSPQAKVVNKKPKLNVDLEADMKNLQITSSSQKIPALKDRGDFLVTKKIGCNKKLARRGDKILPKMTNGQKNGKPEPKEKSTPKSNNDAVVKVNKGIQTIDSDDLSVLHAEGVVKYSTEKLEPNNSKEEKEDPMDIPPIVESEINQNLEKPANDSTDFIKLNKQKVALTSKSGTAANGNTPLNNHKIGVVPKYLKERKEALEKEKLAKIQRAHADCPEGYIALPDPERLETLSMLKKNYKEHVCELNLLPIRSDTLKSRKRKMEIEKQLTKLEEAIKVFSRPKVFVAVDS